MKLKIFFISLITLASAGLVVFDVGGGQVFADSTPSSCTTDTSTSNTSDPSVSTTSTPSSGATASNTSCTPTTGSSTTTPSTATADQTTPSASTGTTTDPSSSCVSNTPSTNTSDVPATSVTATTTTDTTVNNCDQSASTSGSATVSDSGNSNSATSGNANNSINQVNSSNTSQTSTTPTTFTDNVYGDQNGNIVVNPNTASSTPASDSPSNAGVVSVSGSSTINNNESLVSTSGSATVSDSGNSNTATSGNAEAIANVVNLIDSVIASGQSFEGTINIYGNLYGDILLPQSLISQIIPQGSSTTGSSSSLETALVNNNISLVSVSGNATVSDSGNSNTATSGNALTILNLANYINSNINASNLFLVIVNVEGVWQGYVLGQLPVSTSEVMLLGNGLLNNYITQGNSNLTGVNSNVSVINNNIALAAYSGNASIMNSGNSNLATSGNAEALANIINFETSNISLSGWFGILFINIFGNWYGSLTTYADSVNPAAPSATVDAQPEILNQPASTPVSPNNLVYVTYLIYGVRYTADPPLTTTSYITRIVRDKGDSPAVNTPNKHQSINYLIAGLSLLPVIGLAVKERRSYNKKRG